MTQPDEHPIGIYPWRRIDNKLLSICLFQLQKDIAAGKLEIIEEIEKVVGPSENNKKARESFFAWQMRLGERMNEEAEMNHWNQDDTNPAEELNEDRKAVGL